MRKFNPSRLYKFTKIIVILVTLVFIFIGILNYMFILNRTDGGSGDCAKVPDYQYDDCVSVMGSSYKIVDFSIKVAILLPLIFFGGTWIYKYLFPKNE